MWPISCVWVFWFSLCAFHFYSALFPRASSASFAWPTFCTGFGLIPTSRHLSSKHFPCRDYQWAFLNELIHLRLDLYNACCTILDHTFSSGSRPSNHAPLQGQMTSLLSKKKGLNTIIISTGFSSAVMYNLCCIITTLVLLYYC